MRVHNDGQFHNRDGVCRIHFIMTVCADKKPVIMRPNTLPDWPPAGIAERRFYRGHFNKEIIAAPRAPVEFIVMTGIAIKGGAAPGAESGIGLYIAV